MLVKISDIKIKPGRRDAKPKAVTELARSIQAVGLLNPIIVNGDNSLIAGLHRLEAAKELGWTEIECTVSSMDGLQAELAEIDENFVRTNLSHRELGDLLLHRKELYEAIHPETRQGMRNGQTAKNGKLPLLDAKPFSEDTADKLGVSKRTVERLVQTAANLTPEAKRIIHDADEKITRGAALKISRLPPNQQEEAAVRLTTSPSPPKKQNVMDTGTVLREFKAVCCRYISDIKSFYSQTDIIAKMTFLQYDELGASAYAVTNAIRDFFQEVNAIRNPEEENEYEN